jgi:chemotaxis receptor (MCP) glutamine deamidase CheD
MNDGAVVRYVLGAAEVANVPGAPEELDVGMNEFGASRNSGTTLVAAGGPCPIVVLRQLEQHVGALVHISGENAEQDGNDHTILFAQLLGVAPELNAQTQVCICFDPSPAAGAELPDDHDEDDITAQMEVRLAYVEKVEQHLQGLGFNAIARLTHGVGKTVHLNTADGHVMFTDEEENFLELPDDSWAPPGINGEMEDG